MTATQDLIPDEPATLLGVVHPPDDFDEDEIAEGPMMAPTPLTDAAAAIRGAAERVTLQLATLREARAQINDEIRELVAEDDRLKRLVRILDAK